ncbi:MAG: SDR family NAD(P)-dependent oxidoreductase [Planctomycetota bacterium]|nr:MAG: SDR family NAD(P)-dependent oxidoreductase [Planctomycetota bacterium]
MIASRPHLLITGASSGIGAALVEWALAQGWQVSGLARREDRLQDLQQRLDPAGAHFSYYLADVLSQESLDRAVASAVAQRGPLRGVVANAGRGVDGELSDLSAADVAMVYDCNVVGVQRTLRASRPHMGAGSAMVCVSSVAAFLPIPRMGAYCATKHALEAWVAAARMELRDADIRILSCCPGTVATEFFASAPKPGAVWDWRPGSPLRPEQVARAILRQVRRRRPRRIILPWFARLAAVLYAISPGFGEWLMGRALRRMRQRENPPSV